MDGDKDLAVHFWIIFRPGVIKEIPRPLIGSADAGAGAQLPSETRGRGLYQRHNHIMARLM